MWEERFVLDVWYVDHVSLWLDLKIILLMIWKVIKREGINQTEKATEEAFKGNSFSNSNQKQEITMSDRKTILIVLDDLLELTPGTLTGSEELKNIEAWDSLAVMAFIAMVDEEFNVMVPPAQLAKSKTVADLITLIEEHTKL